MTDWTGYGGPSHPLSPPLRALNQAVGDLVTMADIAATKAATGLYRAIEVPTRHREQVGHEVDTALAYINWTNRHED